MSNTDAWNELLQLEQKLYRVMELRDKLPGLMFKPGTEEVIIDKLRESMTNVRHALSQNEFDRSLIRVIYDEPHGRVIFMAADTDYSHMGATWYFYQTAMNAEATKMLIDTNTPHALPQVEASQYLTRIANARRSAIRPPFAHPRLGMFEAGYNPLHGPGPTGYRGFNTSSFSPDGIRRNESQIDIWVTGFDEVRPYFDPFEKNGFDVAHEIAIFETIMEHNCGPNLERRWRFNMVGRWDEGQQVSARMLLETYEIGVQTPISTYVVTFGYQPTMGGQYPNQGWAPSSKI